MAVKVPKIIGESLQVVRDSGKTNMFDTSAVQYWANEFSLYELVLWIEDHSSELVNIVFTGLEMDDEELTEDQETRLAEAREENEDDALYQESIADLV